MNIDSACPMCPGTIRNLSATVHNLANRLDGHAQYADSPCKIGDKWASMVDAARGVVLPADAPPELSNLLEVARAASKCETIKDLLEFRSSLREAARRVRPLSDAHFANYQHSHGEVTAPFRNQ